MDKLKICYVCGGAPNIRAIKDRNFIGQEMYKATAMCPFCGEILQSEWNEIQSCLSLYHQSMLIDCPLRLGFYIFASNKNEAYARWNRRADNA